MGLKRSSVVRLSRLAVVDKGLLLGSLERVNPERFDRLRARLCRWVCGTA
jgi:mRNA interferase MazF